MLPEVSNDTRRLEIEIILEAMPASWSSPMEVSLSSPTTPSPGEMLVTCNLVSGASFAFPASDHCPKISFLLR